jgi:hypothetical protein
LEHNLTDQYLQEQFIGKTFNDKLNVEIADYFSERKFSVLGYLPRPGAIAVVHTVDESGGIKAIGGSDPFDIINNNFGKWLAALHSPLVHNLNRPQTLIGQGNPAIDINGNPGNFYWYNTTISAYNGGPSGGVTSMQIGQGVTAPSVSDFNVETPFANGGAEDVRTTTAQGAYAPTQARVSVAVSIGPTAGIGSISELCLYMNWRSVSEIMLSHDAIAPAIDFVGGETIFAQYFFQL